MTTQPDIDLITAVASAIPALALGIFVGVALRGIVKPWDEPKTPFQLARVWLGNALFATSLLLFTKFVLDQNIDTFLIFLINATVWGILAFCSGWLYGKTFYFNDSNRKLKKQKKELKKELEHKLEKIKLNEEIRDLKTLVYKDEQE